MEGKFYNLTQPQKSIWLTEQFCANTSVNNIGGYVYIHEVVDFKILEKALNEYIRINEATRFQINLVNEEPTQYVKEYSYFPISIENLENENALISWNEKIIHTPFSIVDSPLYSITMFRLKNGHGGFNATLHHLVSDAWTMGLLISQVMEIYSKLLHQEEFELTPPPYSEFIMSEQDYLKSPKFEKAKEFWNNIFDSAPEITSITSQKGNNSNMVAKREAFILDNDIYGKITEFCKTLNCSVYTFFMAIYSIYLSKLTNCNSPIIGTPVLNRTNFKEKNTSGMFISTVPFKVTIEKEQSFQEFLKNVAVMQMSIFRHQKYPYSKLLEDLKKKYDFTENLYDIAFSYQNARDNKEDCDVKFTSNWLFSGYSNDTLQIHFYDMDNTGNMNIYYDYQVAKLSQEEVQLIHERIMHIAEQVMNDSNMLVKNIEIVTVEEKEQILNQFNQTAISYDKEESLVNIFEKYAVEHPDKTALVFENESWTYEKLNEKANQFAHYLRNQSISSNDKIAILLPRCSELILLMLAIKKAACAYLLIEPSLPLERIQYMLKNAQISLLITNKELYNEKLPSTILLEDIPFEKFSTDNLNLSYLPEDLLSIVYTSGSTGMPKGILVKNFSILNLVLGYNHSMKAHTLENFLSICSVSFDMFAAEVWIPLLLGKKLILATEEESKNPILMSQLIEKEAVEFMLITSSKMDLLLFNKTASTCLSKLKSIQLGGEVLNPEFYRKLTYYTNAKIYNGYGPSETTSCATCQLITSDDHITIGTPLPNVQVYICNQFLNLCPIGVIGELCISGDGVSYGYVNQPKLTEKNFVKNPFGNGILYKTGDLAKFLPNGEIEYVGRNDSQVKIRGLRIELEEINKIVQNSSSIDKAVTIVRKLNGIDCICSYVVANTDLDETILKNTLKEKLPYYMVPSHIVFMNSLPLTVNGKIDTKNLPNPQITEQEYIAPKTEIEIEVIDILENLLELEKISMNSNFFDLGGDSLCAIKLVSEVYSKLHIKLEVKDVFKYNTIADICNYISTLEINDAKDEVISLASIADSYPASSAQKRVYYAVQMEGNNSLAYNTPVGINFDKLPDIKKLENGIQKIIQENESFRTYFVLENNVVVQKIKSDFTFSLPVVHEKRTNLEKIFNEFVKPFDLSACPLFRIKLVVFEDDTAMLLLDMHHIICDGESVNIFIEQLTNFYNDKQIISSNIDYKDFAVWEKEYLNSSKFLTDETYWTKQFENAISILNMPTTYPRPTVQSFEGNKIFATLQNKKQIDSICQQLHITPYVFLLGAYYILLYKYTNQEEIIVGTPVVGRNLAELHSIIGMFVNTLAFKQKLDSSLSIEAFLQQLSTYTLEAFEHQTYPFDELVKKLNINRDSSRNAIFDTMFIYQNMGKPEINLQNLKTDYYIPANYTSKFDFSMEICPEKENLEISLEYATKLFSNNFMKEFLNHYINIVTNMINNITQPIQEISILTDTEKQTILEKLNNTAVQYDKNKTIHRLIVEQCKKTPDAIAIKFQEQEITYRELDEYSNQVANYLMKKGVHRGSIVGIMLPRSLEVLIAILGTLKSGACYIPIDPKFPQNRIEYMLNNSNCETVLTFCSLFDRINFNSLVDVELSNKEIYNDYTSCPIINNEPLDPSYLIYTSGSTGNPKGVLLNHMALTNLTNYLNNYVEFLKHDYGNMSMVSMTTVSFDIFIFETLICLQKGLKIIMTTEDEQTSPNLLNNLIEKEKIRAIQLTPSRMQFLVEHKDLIPNLGKIEFVTLAGEALPNTLLKELLNLGVKKVYNGYGPSETTVFSTFTDVTDYEHVTIGKPLNNTQIYILDKEKNLLPVGVPGEIYIAGDGLALEYINNPEITKNSFVPNPFEPSKLMYKTGDLAKYLENGEIDYIGRVDHQIKIRGLRIELDEIEKWILKYPNIGKVTLVAQEIHNRKFLIAYIVPTERISVTQLRTYLYINLPRYMVPSYFIMLDDFPYLPNGKIDKKSLPIPNIMKEEGKHEYVAPITKMETELVNLFEKILGTTPIGIYDNFFHLGGDSLLAMNLQVELLKMSKNITYSDIFMYPTVKELAYKIQTDKKTNYEMQNEEALVELSKTIENTTILPKAFSEKKFGNVFLSGATGFLGIHILSDFLETQKGNIYCLIRSEVGLNVENKLLNKLRFYFSNKYDSYINNRIHIVNGDLTQVNFGLSEEVLDNLGQNVDLVINCAAKVSHYGNYTDYKKVNVDGTSHMLEFAKKYNKRFYQISTLSISGNALADQSFIHQSFENDFDFKENNFFIKQNLDNVYVRSKFEAEKLVLQSIKEGVDSYILRIGNLMGRYCDGKFQKNVEENAYINRLLSFAKIGCIPDYLNNGYLEFTPVDKCAEAIIKIIRSSNQKNRVFHLLNDRTIFIKDFLMIYNKLYGNIKIVNNEEFIKRVQTLLNNENTKTELNGIIGDFNEKYELVYDSKVKLNSNFTVNYLNKLGFTWPDVDENYIKLFFDYLTTLGYLK